MKLSLSASKGDTISQAIIAQIESDLARASKAILEEHKKQIIKELEVVQSDLVTRAAIRIARHSSIRTMEDRIIIEVMDRTKS